MEQWTYWIHLPGVLLDGGGDECAWAGGYLCRMEHDTWHELDQTVWQPTDFADCCPVFYRGQVQGSRETFWPFWPVLSVFDTLKQARSRIHYALSLVTTWPLPPDPRLSCAYLKSEQEERCQVFLVGPSGRDWILTGRYRAPRHLLSAKLLEQAERCDRQLQAIRETLPDSWFEGALQALALASLPDAYVSDGGPPRWHLVYLNAVSALENLLLAGGETGGSVSESITAAFSRRAAVLVVDDFDAVAEMSERIRKVYRLRSDLLHGRRGLDLANEDELHVVRVGLVLLQLVLRGVLALLAGRGAVQDVVTQLAQAAGEPAQFEALREAILEGNEL